MSFRDAVSAIEARNAFLIVGKSITDTLWAHSSGFSDKITWLSLFPCSIIPKLFRCFMIISLCIA